MNVSDHDYTPWNLRLEIPKTVNGGEKISARSQIGERAALRRVQGDDKFTAEGRVVLDAHLLEHVAGHPDVTQVHPARPLRQRQWQAQGQGPLGLHRQPLSAHRRVYAQHRRSVLVGPVGRRPVPGLVHQECVFMAVQTVDDEVHGGVWQVCGREDERLV